MGDYGLYTPEGDLLTVNMGPHHPSTHGVIKFVIDIDSEIIHKITPEIGFLHRSIEKIAEKVTYPGFLPYTDRVDYLAAISANVTYAMAVEKLLEIEIPKRAQYLRVIAIELNRIASHLIFVGAYAMDLGAFTPFLHAIRERERTNDLFEALCGQRLTHHYIRIGGVSHDLPPGWKERALEWLDHFDKFIDEFNRLITFNHIFVKRMANVVVISPEEAINHGLVGPNLRASGVKWDLRKDEPYLVYPELDFEVAVGTGMMGTVGDSFDRLWVRILEMRESAKIIRQALEQMPEGEIRAKTPRIIKPAPNEVYVRTEAPRGDMGFYVISDGSPRPYRVKIRTGSFNAMTIFEDIKDPIMIQDLVVLISSLDIVAPEIDR